MTQYLAPEQQTQYEDQGYLVLPRFFTDKEVEEVCLEISSILDRYPDVPEGLVQIEPSIADGRVESETVELGVRKLARMATHNPVFRRIGFHPRMLAVASDLLGPDVVLLQTMALMKPPRFGGPKVWHQDNAYFRLTPCHVFGFWIACDDANVENGCMHMVPCSNNSGTFEHRGSGDSYGLVDEPDENSVVPVPLRSGDAMIFDSEVWHHSPNNSSDRRRRALQYHYAASHCQRLVDGVSSPLKGEIVVAGRGAESE